MKKYALCLLIFCLAACAAKERPPFDEAVWRARVEATDTSLLYAEHVDKDGYFFNPWMPRENQSFSIVKVLQYIFSAEEEYAYDFPVEDYVHVENSYDYLPDLSNSSISFAGHASFVIKMSGQTILTDPFFSAKAFTVSKDVKIEFPFDKLNERPVVLISHNHYDHLDKRSVLKLVEKGAVFIVPLELGKYMRNKGAAEVYELDWWQSVELDGIKYTMVPAQHWSKRAAQATNSTLWGGFVIEGAKTIYFAGDTGYFKGFAELGRRFDIDYALIPAGVHTPREMMYYAHQNVEEFFMALDDTGAKIGIPMHLGVIQLGKEPVLYPLYEIDEYLKESPQYQDKTQALRVGEYISIN